MPVDDKLPSSIQEGIATAVALVNDDNSNTIAGTIEVEYLDPPYDDIVSRCIEYRKEFKRPPGKEHIDDVFAHILEDRDHKSHGLYDKIITSMVRLASGNLDTAFIASKVAEFIALKKVRAGIEKAVERYQKGGPNIFDDLDGIFRDNMRIRKRSLDNRFTLRNDSALDFLSKDANDSCAIDIEELDVHGCHPARRELLLFMAARNRGKSFFLHHVGKHAMKKGWLGVHYTMENDAAMTSQRYFQMMYSGVKRPGDYHYTTFSEGRDGVRLSRISLKPTFVIESKDETREFLAKKMKDDYFLDNIIIKEVISGKFSFDMLERDLDELALLHKIQPDYILLDSPQLMKMKRGEYSELDEMLIRLRGLAQERNMAVVGTHQGNRAGENAAIMQSQHASGTIGAFAIPDNVITYSQTESEEEHGLARLTAAKVRNDSARFTVCISQHYPSGQFCMSSRYMTSKLRDEIKAYVGLKRDEEDEFEEDERPVRKARS